MLLLEDKQNRRRIARQFELTVLTAQTGPYIQRADNPLPQLFRPSTVEPRKQPISDMSDDSDDVPYDGYLHYTDCEDSDTAEEESPEPEGSSEADSDSDYEEGEPEPESDGDTDDGDYVPTDDSDNESGGE